MWTKDEVEARLIWIKDEVILTKISRSLTVTVIYQVSCQLAVLFVVRNVEYVEYQL